MIQAGSRLPGRRIAAVSLGLAVILGVGQPMGPMVAIEFATGPVYRGTFSWTSPALSAIAPSGHGFLAITAFQGRFVAAERDGVASTSVDGATWVGHPLPGPNAGPSLVLIAAGVSRVAIIGPGVAWTSPDGEAWTAATIPPPGPARPTAIAAAGSGFVAVGIAPDGRHAVAWSSADGSAWSTSPDQAAFDHFCPTAVATAANGRIVAVGDDCYPYLARPGTTVSDDGGLTWRSAPPQPQLSEEGRLTAVIAGGLGFIAAGPIIRDVYPRFAGAAIYVSVDGVSWRRVAWFTAPLAGAGRLFLERIPGGYLAVATGSPRAATFVSVDGRQWTPSSSLPTMLHASNDDFIDAFTGFVAQGDAIVGVGTADHVLFVDVPENGAFSVVGDLTPHPPTTGPIPVPPAVPTPVAGPVQPQPPFPGKVTWSVTPLPISPPPGLGVLSSNVVDVARWRGGFVALGAESFASSPFARHVVWASPDGTRWMEHPLPATCGSTDGAIAATQTAMVVAGDAGICRSADGIRWTRSTDLPHQIRGFVDVIPYGTGFALTMGYRTGNAVFLRVWLSADGRQWRLAPHPATFTNVTPRAIATGARGLVILGQQFRSGFGYLPTVVALRSRDGVTWSKRLRQQTFEPMSFGSDEPTLTAGGPGYVAAGSYEPRSRTGAAVWTSADGLAWKRVYLVMPASGYVEFDGAARIGSGYAIVGLLAPPSQEDPARPTVWLSPDGLRWRSGIALPLPTDGPVTWVEFRGAAGGSARIVAAATVYGIGGPSRAEVWTGTYRAP